MDNETVKVICKIIPGFESIAIEECLDLFNIVAEVHLRGRVSLHIKINDICRLAELRSVSHYMVVVSEQDNFFGNPDATTEDTTERLQKLPNELCWQKAMQAWKFFKVNYKSKFFASAKAEVKGKQEGDGNTNTLDENNGVPQDDVDCNGNDNPEEQLKLNELKLEDLADIDPITAGEKLAFRCTAERTGKHNFSSMDAARYFGGGVNDTFFWKVNMEKFNIEVMVYVLHTSLTIGIQLTTENQSSRNITHFGPTTLKANISFCMLKYAQVAVGDIVCDPMCGSGSISIEGALGCPGTFHMAGDYHSIGIDHSTMNIQAIETEGGRPSLPVSCIQWDVYQLPLRTASVDRIVTDLPFGKRIGNKSRNLFLYPVCLREMARICRPHGKAALLTSHKGALAKAVKKCDYWKQYDVKKIYMGGLDAVVYLLGRTDVEYTKSKPTDDISTVNCLALDNTTVS